MGRHTGYTKFIYRGVELRDAQILDLQEVMKYDESGIEVTSKVVQLKILGYYFGQNTALKDGVSNLPEERHFGTYPQFDMQSSASEPKPAASAHAAWLNQFLMIPRGELKLLFNAQQGRAEAATEGEVGTDSVEHLLYHVIAAPEDITGTASEMNQLHDVGGGPKPKSINISQITGDNSWRVEFAIEFEVTQRCYLDPTDNPLFELDPEQWLYPQFKNGELTAINFTQEHRRQGVKSNRWSCVDTIDADRYLVREIEGLVELANPTWNPQDYRVLCLPPLAPGMERTDMKFTSSRDGLQLQYSFTDKEVTMTGVGDFRNIEVELTQTRGRMVEAITMLNLQVTVKGGRESNREEMISTAHAIADSKLMLTQKMEAEEWGFVIERAELTDRQGTAQENSVTLRVQIKQVPDRRQQPPNAGDEKQIVHSVIATMTGDGARRITAAVAGALNNDSLVGYNNQLGEGNRSGEIPPFSGPIGSLGALAANLKTKCASDWSMAPAIEAQMTTTPRADRTTKVGLLAADTDVTQYDATTIFDAADLVEIVESVVEVPTNRFSAAAMTQVYQEYGVQSWYQNKYNVHGMPSSDVAAGTTANPATAVVALGPPQPGRIIQIEASRVGAPPRMPTPIAVIDDNGVPAYLHSEETHFKNPEADATDSIRALTYTARLVLHYIYTVIPDKMRMGIPDTHAPAGASSADPNRLLYETTRGTLFSADWNVNE